MRFSNRCIKLGLVSKNSHVSRAARSRLSRFEELESRALLSLSTSSLDYRALQDADSFGDSENNAIWVTSLQDSVNASDGKVTLREALDYAGQSLTAGEVSSTIRFKVGGTITLSSSLQSLKILSKSVTIDASDVGGIAVQASQTLALYVFGGSTSSPINVSISNMTFTGAGTSPSVSGSTAKGGAIQLAPNCNLSLNHCSVVDNYSSSALGVGIYVASGNLTLNDVLFSGNVSDGNISKGGAVYVDAGTVKGTNVVFTNNSASEGGALYVKNGSVNIVNGQFDDNVATYGNAGAIYSNVELSIENSSFRNNSSFNAGGAIFITGDSSSSLSDVVFTGNKAAQGGAVMQDGQDLSITNAQFTNNTASQDGGAHYIDSNALAILNNVNYASNQATNDGGALFNNGSLYITGANLTENQAQDGGGIYSSGYFEIRRTSCVKNVASSRGGAIYLDNSYRSWLFDSTVDSSEALEGGALFNCGELTIANSNFYANVALNSGGAFGNSGTLVITGSKFENNVAQGTAGEGGAGLNYVNASLSITDSQIRQNTSVNGSGGGLSNHGSAVLNASSISQNTSELLGGGLYNAGELTASYTSFSENVSQNGGGLADVYGSSSIHEGNLFRSNVASGNGGALYSYGLSTFTNTVIKNNSASQASTAAYYSPSTTIEEPSFDDKCIIENNGSITSAPNQISSNVILIQDLESGEIISNPLSFNGNPVTSDPIVKRLLLTNVSASDLLLSSLAIDESSASKAFSYQLSSSLTGAALNLGDDVSLASGESVYLTVTMTPKVTGATYFELTWAVNAIDEAGSTSTSFLSVSGSAEVSKIASSNLRIGNLESSSYNISINENGSFSISLAKKPSSNVILYLNASSDTASLSTDVLLFTPENYKEYQTITVSLNSQLANVDVPDTITLHTHLLTPDSSFNGTTFAPIILSVEDSLVINDDCSVNLKDYAPSGISRWDLNNDGVVEEILNGQNDCWVDSSLINSSKISYTQTNVGVTERTNLGVASIISPPTADVELQTFNNIPGFVRLSLESENQPVSRWRINWGDDSPFSIVDSLSLEACFAHTYQNDGDYVISVELVNDDGVGEGIWSTLDVVHIEGSSSNVLLDQAIADECKLELNDDILDELCVSILAND